MKFEREATTKNGRRTWKVTYELVRGPEPKRKRKDNKLATSDPQKPAVKPEAEKSKAKKSKAKKSKAKNFSPAKSQPKKSESKATRATKKKPKEGGAQLGMF